MKAGHGEKLTRKMELAVAALLMTPTMQTASRKVGVSESTLARWLKQSQFQRCYREARRNVVEGAVARLQTATGAAVEALVRNLNSGNAATEIAAAREILRQAVQAIEIWDIAGRVDAMEKQSDGGIPVFEYKLVTHDSVETTD